MQDNEDKQNAGAEDDVPSLHDIVLDKDGKVAEVFDRENNKRFKTGPEVEEQQPEEGKEKGNENGSPVIEGEEPVLEFQNFPDLIVNKIMGNNIEFPADMPIEEQAKVVAESVEDIITHYEQQLKEAKKGIGLTPYEQEIISALREGKSLTDLVGDQASVSLNLEDKDSVVKYKLQSENPSWTDEEIADEVKHLKDTNRFERHYKSSKDAIQRLQQDYQKELEVKQTQSLARMQQEEAENFKKEIQELGSVFSQVESLYEVPVDDEMRKLAFKYAGEINPQTGQTRLQDLLSTPQGLAEVALLKLFGQEIMKSVKESGYKKGRKEEIGKYPSQPIITDKTAQQGKYQYNLDKLSEVDSIGTVD